MSQGVVFRRVGGHIIPIKINPPEHNKTKHSAALVAAGTGVAAAAGAVAGHLDTKAALAKSASKNISAQKTLKFRISPQFREGARHRLDSIRSHKSAARIKKGGALIGASLIGAGVHKALDKTEVSETTKSTIASGAGIASYLGVRTAQTKVFGRTSLKFAIKHAFSRVLVRGTKL